MDVRQRTEEIEHLTFAPWATFSDASRGRAVPEPQDPLRPVFQRDRDRVRAWVLPIFGETIMAFLR